MRERVVVSELPLVYGIFTTLTETLVDFNPLNCQASIQKSRFFIRINFHFPTRFLTIDLI